MALPIALVVLLVAVGGGLAVEGRLSVNRNVAGYPERLERQAAVAEEVLGGIRRNETRRGSSPLITPACEADLDVFNAALVEGKTWADAMYSSWGVPESHFWQGDNYWEGGYDTCAEYRQLWRQTGEEGLPARFCLVEWESLVYIETSIFTSRDGIALCLPQSCTEDDFIEYIYTGALLGTIEVPPAFPLLFPDDLSAFCVQTEEEQHEQLRNDPSAIACFCVIGFFLLLAAIGTTYDVVGMYKMDAYDKRAKNADKYDYVNGGYDAHVASANGYTNNGDFASTKTRHDETWKPGTFGKILLAFSISRNAAAIMNFKQPKGKIEFLHGLRFLSFSFIVFGQVFQSGGETRPSIGPVARLPQMRFARTSAPIIHSNMSADTFFLLSAFLTTVGFLRKLQKQRPDCQMMGIYYFHRFWRLTPVYMFILMFYGCVFPYLWRGPFYDPDFPDAADCRTGWWQNFLYLNNVLRENGNCMGWTWWQANNFQFYVFAPAVLFPLFYMPSFGITLGVLCGVGGVISRGVITHKFLVLEQPTEYVWDSFVKPWSRCAPYFLGMMLGFLLHKLKFKARMHPGYVVLGWMIGIFLVWFPVFASLTQTFIPTRQAVVAWDATQRVMFTVGVSWIIFACITMNGGFINSILSWSGWLPWARLSYVGYLIHPIIIYWRAHVSPNQQYTTYWELIFVFLGMMMITMGASLVVSVLFERPFVILERLMFANVPAPKPNTETTRAMAEEGERVEAGTQTSDKFTNLADKEDTLTPASPPMFGLTTTVESANL